MGESSQYADLSTKSISYMNFADYNSELKL